MQDLCVWVHFPVHSSHKCTAGMHAGLDVRFFLALLIGAAVAGVCSVLLIGIPVLRLKGDYLAIVTLAFGEIIKNLINVFFIGKDANGFHFSMKDAMSLEHGRRRCYH